MPELSRFERVLNKINYRMNRIGGNIEKDMKGVKPFDMEILPPREALYKYEQMTPQDHEIAKQVPGYDDYVARMEKLREEYNA